ncbi:hypothetical protein RB6323 [Rhodopirellula baltica SH 1]|uniref:Uncharacterized protein n=1 Tax=Rhodopirellula baltica (strain DSM 10527 / NCIMB 13988 / SH1) TaxID=243090 RepID=Q7UQH7_RHOBA|nr:hypothetical protein RB6323 [Rhodopirellula baltica SH 1]
MPAAVGRIARRLVRKAYSRREQANHSLIRRLRWFTTHHIRSWSGVLESDHFKLSMPSR